MQDILENKRYNKNITITKKIIDKNNNLNIKEEIPLDSYQNNIINLNAYDFKQKKNKNIQIKDNPHNSNNKRIFQKGLTSNSNRESPSDNNRRKKNIKNIKKIKSQPIDKMNTYNFGNNISKNINNFNDSQKKENIKNLNLDNLESNNSNIKANFKEKKLINSSNYNTNNNTTKNNDYNKKFGFSQNISEDRKTKISQNLQLIPKNSDDIEQNENQEFFNINFQNLNNSIKFNINNTKNNTMNKIKNNNYNNSTTKNK